MKTNNYPVPANNHVARINIFISYKTTGNADTEGSEQPYIKATKTAEEYCAPFSKSGYLADMRTTNVKGAPSRYFE